MDRTYFKLVDDFGECARLANCIAMNRNYLAQCDYIEQGKIHDLLKKSCELRQALQSIITEQSNERCGTQR